MVFLIKLYYYQVQILVSPLYTIFLQNFFFKKILFKFFSLFFFDFFLSRTRITYQKYIFLLRSDNFKLNLKIYKLNTLFSSF